MTSQKAVGVGDPGPSCAQSQHLTPPHRAAASRATHCPHHRVPARLQLLPPLPPATGHSSAGTITPASTHQQLPLRIPTEALKGLLPECFVGSSLLLGSAHCPPLMKHSRDHLHCGPRPPPRPHSRLGSSPPSCRASAYHVEANNRKAVHLEHRGRSARWTTTRTTRYWDLPTPVPDMDSSTESGPSQAHPPDCAAGSPLG